MWQLGLFLWVPGYLGLAEGDGSGRWVIQKGMSLNLSCHDLPQPLEGVTGVPGCPRPSRPSRAHASPSPVASTFLTSCGLQLYMVSGTSIAPTQKTTRQWSSSHAPKSSTRASRAAAASWGTWACATVPSCSATSALSWVASITSAGT